MADPAFTDAFGPQQQAVRELFRSDECDTVRLTKVGLRLKMPRRARAGILAFQFHRSDLAAVGVLWYPTFSVL